MWEWKEKRGTMRHYDRQAAIYDEQYVSEQNTKIEDTLNCIKFDSNELVLDLGCGTGFLFHRVAQNVKHLVGVDVSQNALKQAKKRTKNVSNIVLVRADADNTPFPNHTFDKIFAITVLQNMPDPKKTIIEMKRTGKPEAVFAVTGLKKKYTQENFVDILESAHLKVVKLNSSQQLKGHVVVCQKIETAV